MTYVDLLGKPLSVGDTVAYPAVVGRSAKMTVGTIEDIKTYKETRVQWRGNAPRPGERGETERYEVELWKAVIQPLHWTGNYWSAHSDKPARKVTITRTENLVKVEPGSE